MKKDLKISKNTAIHCPTKKLADKVSVILNDLGFRWSTGDRFVDECYWYKCEKDYCIYLHDCTYSSIVHLEKRKHALISAEDFIKLHKKENMKKKLVKVPFDMKKAKNGATVVTRDGRNVRIICYDRKGDYPIVTLMMDSNCIELLDLHRENGMCNKHCESPNDLFILEEIEVETVQISGKTYLKSDLEEALSKLIPID